MLACFSSKYAAREQTYMNEELTQIVEGIRKRPTDRVWFIPIRFDDCAIPDRRISATEVLADIQAVDLHLGWDEGVDSIVLVLGLDDPTAVGAMRVARDRPKSSSTELVPNLTAAELRVLAYLPTHKSYQAMAEDLFVSRNTVKTMAISIFRKLGVNSRGDAVAEAIRFGLIEPQLPR